MSRITRRLNNDLANVFIAFALETFAGGSACGECMYSTMHNELTADMRFYAQRLVFLNHLHQCDVFYYEIVVRLQKQSNLNSMMHHQMHLSIAFMQFSSIFFFCIDLLYSYNLENVIQSV